MRPPRSRRRPPAWPLAAAACCAAIAVAGCGAPPPQPPAAQAQRIGNALSEIAEACGESYQEHAFQQRPPGIAALEAKAGAHARELAAVFHEDPSWVYQGSTVAQIVGMTAGYLRECGLSGAASTLARATRPQPAPPRPAHLFSRRPAG